MRFRTLIAIVVTMCALPVLAAELPLAPMPRAANQNVVVKLRNVAAADVVPVIEQHLKARKLTAGLIAEPVSNTVLVSAAPALMPQLLHILTALDKEPPQVILTVMVMDVSDAFVENCGLNVGAAPGATSWTLTERERYMLNAFIREAKGRGEIDVLARPMIAVSDNQTGFVHIGQDFPLPVAVGGTQVYVPLGYTLRATPRVGPDGRVQLRAEFQSVELKSVAVTAPGLLFPVTRRVSRFNTQGFQQTSELKTGETLVTRVGNTLVLITPTVTMK